MKLLIVLCILGVALALPFQGSRQELAPMQISIDTLHNYGVDEKFVREFVEKMQHIDPRDISTTLNDYADKIFANIKEFVIHHGLDPYGMPDIHEGFNFTFLFIKYHGELDMTSGSLQDISSMHRGGDVIANYNPKTENLIVTVPINFGDLSFNYDYSAKLMNLGPTGGVEGKITDLKVKVVIGFDFKKIAASLEKFVILNSGHISVNLSGHGIIDDILNILINVASSVLHRVILIVIEAIVRTPIQAIVDAINDLINNILNPTEAPAYFLNNMYYA